jgi:hypothetical protein
MLLLLLAAWLMTVGYGIAWYGKTAFDTDGNIGISFLDAFVPGKTVASAGAPQNFVGTPPTPGSPLGIGKTFAPS